MKDKIYHVKHDFGNTNITYPEEGIPIKLNINMTFQTFSFLLMLIGAIGLIVIECIEIIVK
jgi:hypothetical protein